MKILRYFFFFFLISFLFISTAYSKTITYNSAAAVTYALAHCTTGDPTDNPPGGYNPNYKCWNADMQRCINDNPQIKVWDAEKGKWVYKHVDCANFVSQCLIEEGGIKFGRGKAKGLNSPNYYTKLTVGNFPIRKGERAGVWGLPNAEDLYRVLQISYELEFRGHHT